MITGSCRAGSLYGKLVGLHVIQANGSSAFASSRRMGLPPKRQAAGRTLEPKPQTSFRDCASRYVSFRHKPHPR